MKTHYAPALPIGSATPICNRHIQGYELSTARREDVTCKRCRVLMKPRKDVKK